MILDKLFDEGTAFNDGFGKVAGNTICVYVQDVNVKSGAVNLSAAIKMQKAYESAVKYGCPLVTVWNSKGGDIGEGVDLIAAYSNIIGNHAQLSGVVPLISIVTGQCSGLNAALCRMSDIIIAVPDAEIFLTPPFLGGSTENIADITAETEEKAVLITRELLTVLPPNNLECSAGFPAADIRLSPVTAFSSLAGITVGTVTLSERLGADDTMRVARFVRFCNAFSLPVITYIDNDGIDPAVSIHEAASMARAYACAATPKLAVITGKACGAAFMLAGGFGNDFVLAHEDAVISPAAIRTAAAFLEISEEDYIRNHASADIALGKGYIDMIVTPAETQNALINVLDIARNKRIASHPKKKGC